MAQRFFLKDRVVLIERDAFQAGDGEKDKEREDSCNRDLWWP